MDITDAISTEEMRTKLRNLKTYLPGRDQFTYDFWVYLGERLRNPQINPMGFNMTAQLVLYDLQTGVDGFTGKPVPHSLSGMPPCMYVVMEMNIPKIARAVCPPDFAEAVQKVYDDVHKG
ncbi:MAG: hypothetical protein AABX04_02580 [Nanoarchaeota archaeon]